MALHNSEIQCCRLEVGKTFLCSGNNVTTNSETTLWSRAFRYTGVEFPCLKGDKHIFNKIEIDSDEPFINGKIIITSYK